MTRGIGSTPLHEPEQQQDHSRQKASCSTPSSDSSQPSESCSCSWKKTKKKVGVRNFRLSRWKPRLVLEEGRGMNVGGVADGGGSDPLLEEE